MRGVGILAESGVVAIIAASVWLFWIRTRRRGGVRTQGTVIGNRSSAIFLGSYAPVIRFGTQDGRTVEFESNMYTPVRYEVGKQVPVVYRPSKPEQAILDTALGTWLIPTAFLVVGVVLIVLGLIGLLSGSR